MPSRNTDPFTPEAHENVLAVQELLQAFGNADIQAVLDMYADEIDWFVPGGKDIPYSGSRTTKAELADYFKVTKETVDVKTMQPLGFTASGNKVVLQGLAKGIAVKSEQPFEYEWVMVYIRENGLFTGYRLYFDTVAVAAAING